jgi:hypothetical protein
MTRPRPLPESLLTSPFSREDALDLGVPPGRLRALDLHRPFRGIRTAEAATDVRALCRAYAPIMSPDQLFSHVTAARLYGFPLPRRLERQKQLDVWAESVQAKDTGVIGHRSRWLPSRIVEGLPVVDPVHVLVQLADLLGRDDLTAVGDYLVQRKEPLATLSRIKEVVFESKGVRGIRALRLAAADVRTGTDSPMETKLRLVIVRGGLPEPVIGHTITTADGAFVGTPDLAYVAQRIAIEYEGDIHRVDRLTFANDIERRERMQEEDWYVIRVISGHLYPNPAWLLSRIRQQLHLRRQTPSSAL